MKKCSKCDETKILSEFGKSNKTKSGLRAECKLCRTKESKLHYKTNIDKIKKYLDDNNTKIREKKTNYRIENKEKVKESAKISNKKYREKPENKEKIKEYIKNNYENLKEKRRIYKKNKLLNDPLYKLKHNISCLIRISFKCKNIKKDNKTVEILGCSVEEFRTHIESQFSPWMNWTNHGKYKKDTFNLGWDMDHIEPISLAITKEDVIRLNHWTNFKPLCSKVNRDIKRNNLTNKSS